MRKRHLLGLAAACLGTLLLAWILYNSVRSLLAYPLIYLAWAIEQIYKYTPSWAIWGLLLIMMLLMAATSLIRPYDISPEENEEKTYRLHRRVILLVRWLNQRHRPYFRHHINHELTELSAKILAERYHAPIHVVRSAIRDGLIDIPLDLAPYLQRGLSMWGDMDEERFGWLSALVRPERFEEPKDDREILRTLEFLEDQMEVNHDPGYFDRRQDQPAGLE